VVALEVGLCPTHHHRRQWLRIRLRVYRSPGTHCGRRPQRRNRQCQTGGVAGMATVAVVVETAARVGCSRVRERTILTGRNRRQILLGMFCSVGLQHTHRVAGLENSFCCGVVTYNVRTAPLVDTTHTHFCIHNFNTRSQRAFRAPSAHNHVYQSHHVNKR
jgi:hypothetical protein